MTKPCEDCKSIKSPTEDYSFQDVRGLYRKHLCLSCRDKLRKELNRQLTSQTNKKRILDRIRGWFK